MTNATVSTDLNLTGTLSVNGSSGTSGYVLTSNGASDPTWEPNANGVAIVDDTTTNATRYLTFTDATTGNITTENVSSTKLQFNPSTGVLSPTSISYTGTLTGGTGVINIGSGQLVKDASGNLLVGTATTSTLSGYTVVGQFKNSIGIVSGSADEFSGALLRESSGSNSISLNADPGNLRAGSFLGFGVDGSERLRITDAGNVGIGTSSPWDSDTRLTLSRAGNTFFAIRNSTNSVDGFIGSVSNAFNYGTATNHPAVFFTNNTERARIDSSGNLMVGTTSANGGLFTVNGNMGPATDNERTCANAFIRWSVVFAATGTINTSDAREKTPVRSLSASEVTASQQLANEIGAYKWLSAVAEKGDAAREHIGMTVQRAIEIMEANGLSPFTYGFICFDENEEMSRYSFRMDELSMFIAKGQQQAIQEQQAIINDLKARLDAANL
jgi:hypothetical protein